MTEAQDASPAGPPDVAGWQFPGGRYTLSAEEDAAFCKAVETSPRGESRAHPALAFVIAQTAMGVSVEALLARCDFEVKDGPMLVHLDLDFFTPLRTGIAYNVSGQIVSLTRKPSRAFGFADSLVFELNLSAAGHHVVRIKNKWILPRRGLA
jgi:hypothetical protein